MQAVGDMSCEIDRQCYQSRNECDVHEQRSEHARLTFGTRSRDPGMGFSGLWADKTARSCCAPDGRDVMSKRACWYRRSLAAFVYAKAPWLWFLSFNKCIQTIVIENVRATVEVRFPIKVIISTLQEMRRCDGCQACSASNVVANVVRLDGLRFLNRNIVQSRVDQNTGKQN